MKVTVIISAYKNCQALRHCLYAYSQQTRLPDQIIIAEDDESRDIADLVRSKVMDGVQVTHVTQPDKGFGKCKINNVAISHAIGDLLIFTDADCIPRNDYVGTHEKMSRRGTFLAGGSHINIPQDFHQNNDIDALIENQGLFDYAFLSHIPGFKKNRLRLTRNRLAARILDVLTQRSVFPGSSSSAFRQDVLAVGGFDESMGYGAEDINLGIRLNNIGIKGRRIRYSLCYVHLDHARGYVDSKVVASNKQHNKMVRKSNQVFPRASSLV